MAVNTASGWVIAIGPAAVDSVDTIAEFEALTPYVDIGEVETLGEFGDESADVTFAALNDARVRHLKGARDAGNLALTVGRDPLDLGQVALKAAEKTNFNYAFRVTALDAPSGDYTNSVAYFRGMVRSARDNVGENDNVVRTTFNIGISSEIYEELSEEIP